MLNGTNDFQVGYEPIKPNSQHISSYYDYRWSLQQLITTLLLLLLILILKQEYSTNYQTILETRNKTTKST